MQEPTSLLVWGEPTSLEGAFVPGNYVPSNFRWGICNPYSILLMKGKYVLYLGINFPIYKGQKDTLSSWS